MWHLVESREVDGRRLFRRTKHLVRHVVDVAARHGDGLAVALQHEGQRLVVVSIAAYVQVEQVLRLVVNGQLGFCHAVTISEHHQLVASLSLYALYGSHNVHRRRRADG